MMPKTGTVRIFSVAAAQKYVNLNKYVIDGQ